MSWRLRIVLVRAGLTSRWVPMERCSDSAALASEIA